MHFIYELSINYLQSQSQFFLYNHIKNLTPKTLSDSNQSLPPKNQSQTCPELVAFTRQSEQQPPLTILSSSSKIQYRVVWAPCTAFFIRYRFRGQRRLCRIFRGREERMLRWRSVRITPGWSETEIPGRPTWVIRRCSYFAKRMFAFLDLEYAATGLYPPFSKFILSKSRSKFFVNDLCARALTLTILGLPAFFKSSHNRQVRQKCPKWLTPICIQRPSQVSLRSGRAMMPALLIRQCKGCPLSSRFTSITNYWIEVLEAKSRWQATAQPFWRAWSYFQVSQFFFSSRAPIITKAPSSTNLVAVSLPIPPLPPVTTTFLPSKLLSMPHHPPSRYLLSPQSAVTDSPRATPLTTSFPLICLLPRLKDREENFGFGVVIFWWIFLVVCLLLLVYFFGFGQRYNVIFQAYL